MSCENLHLDPRLQRPAAKSIHTDGDGGTDAEEGRPSWINRQLEPREQLPRKYSMQRSVFASCFILFFERETSGEKIGDLCKDLGEMMCLGDSYAFHFLTLLLLLLFFYFFIFLFFYVLPQFFFIFSPIVRPANIMWLAPRIASCALTGLSYCTKPKLLCMDTSKTCSASRFKKEYEGEHIFQ